MASLFTLISVIPPLPALPNATSFKSDQVFLEFFMFLEGRVIVHFFADSD